MADTRQIVINFCEQLSPGDGVEVLHEGILVHRGPVTATEPRLGLFWILDTMTGDTRLVDVCESVVIRIPAPVMVPWYRTLFRAGQHGRGRCTGAGVPLVT